MTDDEMSLHISLAMGHIETVRFYEAGQGRKGKIRESRLKNLYDNCGRVIDEYRLVSWQLDKQNLAGEVLDKVQLMITAAFNPKRVTRAANGRFEAVV